MFSYLIEGFWLLTTLAIQRNRWGTGEQKPFLLLLARRGCSKALLNESVFKDLWLPWYEILWLWNFWAKDIDTNKTQVFVTLKRYIQLIMNSVSLHPTFFELIREKVFIRNSVVDRAVVCFSSLEASTFFPQWNRCRIFLLKCRAEGGNGCSWKASGRWKS